MALPRSRVTSPEGASPGLRRFVIILPLIAALAYLFSKLGSALLAIASLIVVPVLLKEVIHTSWSTTRYARTPGILINDSGVTFYGDGGPTHHEWSHFGEAFISSLREKPIIQHLAVEDLDRKGYDRYSFYYLTLIDHVLATPDEILRAISDHPNNPCNSLDLKDRYA